MGASALQGYQRLVPVTQRAGQARPLQNGPSIPAYPLLQDLPFPFLKPNSLHVKSTCKLDLMGLVRRSGVFRNGSWLCCWRFRWRCLAGLGTELLSEHVETRPSARPTRIFGFLCRLTTLWKPGEPQRRDLREFSQIRHVILARNEPPNSPFSFLPSPPLPQHAQPIPHHRLLQRPPPHRTNLHARPNLLRHPSPRPARTHAARRRGA